MLARRLASAAVVATALVAGPGALPAAAAPPCSEVGVRADVRPGGGDERIVVGTQDGRPAITVLGPGARPLDSFFAFDLGFTGGVSVAAGELDGDGRDEIVVGAGPGGGPNVRVFDGARGHLVADFFAFDPSFRGGVRVGVADVDGDGVEDVLARPGGSAARRAGAPAQAFSGTGAILGPVTSLAGLTVDGLARFC